MISSYTTFSAPVPQTTLIKAKDIARPSVTEFEKEQEARTGSLLQSSYEQLIGRQASTPTKTGADGFYGSMSELESASMRLADAALQREMMAQEQKGVQETGLTRLRGEQELGLQEMVGTQGYGLQQLKGSQETSLQQLKGLQDERLLDIRGTQELLQLEESGRQKTALQELQGQQAYNLQGLQGQQAYTLQGLRGAQESGLQSLLGQGLYEKIYGRTY